LVNRNAQSSNVSSLPSITIVIPTYNSASTIHDCLSSIFDQSYPKERIEVIVIDAGSRDATVQIASRFRVRLLRNPLITGEAGKAVGLYEAKGELVAFIDSDNILPSRAWLREMIKPFERGEVAGAEPMFWTYRREDNFLNRYAALYGDPDPSGSYLSSRGHWSWSRMNWTDLKWIQQMNLGSYVLFRLREGLRPPSYGANGFIGRADLLRRAKGDCPYYFDMDIPYILALMGFNTFAKVKVGIIHRFAADVGHFNRKNYRRIRDHLVFRKLRVGFWTINSVDVFRFAISTLTVIPLLIEVVNGYRKKPDLAWLFHPIATWLEFIMYFFVYLGFILGAVGCETKTRN